MDLSRMLLFANDTAAVMVNIDWKMLATVIVGVTSTIGPVTWYVASQFHKNKIANLEEKFKNSEHALQAERRARETAEGLLASANQTVDVQLAALASKDAALAQRDATIVEAKKKVREYYQGWVDLRAKYDNLKRLVTQEGERVEELRAKLAEQSEATAEAQADRAKIQQELDASAERMSEATDVEGQLWQVRPTQAVPAFRPKTEREHVIISVLNLKGGVGKTTITSHLGGALARRGKRVLLVDLDLQGSLSAFMLSQVKISERFHAKRLLQDYFRQEDDMGRLALRDFIVPAEVEGLNGGRLDLIPTTDQLAYAELTLNMNWLLKQGTQDARFVLREGLHAEAFAKSYDVVLLDCPPLLNISAVNALAASDHLLIPAVQGKKALERVPKLVDTVLGPEFVTNINDRLRVLGLIANRTSADVLPQDDQRAWDIAADRLGIRHKCDIKRFATAIPRTQEVQNTELAYRLPPPRSRLCDVFDRLSDELTEEINRDHRNTSPTLREPGELSGAVGSQEGVDR